MLLTMFFAYALCLNCMDSRRSTADNARPAASIWSMTSEDNAGRSGRWQRREERRRSEKERLQKHGATLRRVYIDAVKKRLAERARRNRGTV